MRSEEEIRNMLDWMRDVRVRAIVSQAKPDVIYWLDTIIYWLEWVLEERE